MDPRPLLLAPLAAACLHILEEFVVPGGFASWFRSYVPDDPGITRARLVAVNAILVFLCLCIPLNGTTAMGLALWLTLVGTQVANACFHLRAALRTRRYVPGCVTSLVVYLPMAGWGLGRLLRSGLATPRDAAFQLLLGVGIMLFIDRRYRIRRWLEARKGAAGSPGKLRGVGVWLSFAARAAGWGVLFSGLVNPIFVPAARWMGLGQASMAILANTLSVLLLLASAILAARGTFRGAPGAA